MMYNHTSASSCALDTESDCKSLNVEYQDLIVNHVSFLSFQTDSDQWKIVFFTTAGIYLVGNLVFIILGSGVAQPWNFQQEKQENIEVVATTTRSESS